MQLLEKPIILPPSQPATSNESPSMTLASSLLEKLPPRVRIRAERDFIAKLYELVEEHCTDEDLM